MDWARRAVSVSWVGTSIKKLAAVLRYSSLAGMTLALFVLFPSASRAATQNVYVAQNAAGAGDGADCADALPASWFNNSANWGLAASQISPGTTVHLCGTITSSLTAQGNGASGAPITILFETGAKLSQPYCAGGTCLSISGRSYLIVDGGASCGYISGTVVACNGTIENTANGTNLANQQSVMAINATSTSNVEIRNLLIQNLYVHVGSTDATAQFPDGCVNYNYGNNVSIHNLVAHDMHWCLTGGGSNISLYNNDISHVDHAVTYGNETSGSTTSGIRIYGNHFHDFANWDVGTASNHPYHHDGIQLWGLNSSANASSNNGQVTDLQIYNNLCDGDTGNWITGCIYLMDSVNNAYVYNNVIVGNPNRTIYGQIRIDATSGDNAQGPIHVFNNTVVGNNPGGYCMWATWQNSLSVKNNVFSGCQTLIEVDNSSLAPAGLDNNVYQQTGGGRTFSWNGSSTANLAGWQSSTGQDASATLVSSAGLDPTGLPQSGSPVISAGANLTSLGIQALDLDKDGASRPTSGAWDAGAYLFGASTSRPNPPTGLTATVN
jgi:hypothetical protein